MENKWDFVYSLSIVTFMGMEAELFSQGGEAGLIIVIGIFLMFFMSIILLLFFYFSRKKIIRKELEKKDLEIKHQKELLQSTIEVQEDERIRIARDLHDDISSKLNIVTLNCHMLAMGDINENEQKEALDNIVNLSAKALENSRRIAHDLFPPVFDKFGLNAALKELCSEFNSVNNITVSLQSKVIFEEKDKNRHLHVFRILQELMNNSLRHGKASAIDIVFKEKESYIECRYMDNGKGFNVKQNLHKKGLGMKNIESRISFLGGSITIDSVINKGTEIVFSF